ncbi:hypothetical protein [Donghicola mangrovi]|uniref:Aminoglycoside phosphotransferase domain-containing protein n=1 Tax=Donghicola mangrovi TaxID=2729614 RepID=A0A850Q4M7_9RHOB|nr:hypothetical protein [Donghicola mangrovi]NVO23012.1 hypothetical protein [Donghicola mangrovi]
MARRARQADADVTLNLAEAMAAFGLGDCAGAIPLGRRSWRVRSGSADWVLKLSETAQVAGLRNEARCLAALAEVECRFTESDRWAALLRPYIEGEALAAQPNAMESLSGCLARLHAQGFAFCDLTPANVIHSGGMCHLIDWEFCTPIGTKVEDMPLRPYSSGFTHPDLIWGRGLVRPEFDFFSLERAEVVPENRTHC